MPGKLKVYGKKCGGVVSDAFGKLSDSPLKKNGNEYQNFKSAEALISADAADVGGDRRRRAPLKSKGSNARFAKRDRGKLGYEERLPFDHMSGQTSTERLGQLADDDQSLQDRLECPTEISEEPGAGPLGNMTEPMSSAPRSSIDGDGDIAELEVLLRNTGLQPSSRTLNRNATGRSEETTGATGFTAPETVSRFVREPRKGSKRDPEASRIPQQENHEVDETTDVQQHEPTRKLKKTTVKKGLNDSEEDLPLLKGESTLNATKSEFEASTASWAASSIERRVRNRDSNIMEISLGEGTNMAQPEVTYLPKEDGNMRTTRAPLRTPAPEVSYLSTENGTMRTRRGPVRAPVTRPAASLSEPIVNIEILEYLSPLLEVAKGRLENIPVCSFRDWVDRLCQQNYELVKVGEGSFGETYRTKITPKGSTIPVLGKTIFKVIPLRARTGLGSRNFVPVVEAVSEIELLARMTSIPGFTIYQEAYVVCGSQPPQIVSACDAYIHSPNHRPSDRPFVKRYIPTQLWVVIEMQYAGVDLERLRLSSHWQTWDIFWRVAIALARAEVVARFEVRYLRAVGCTELTWM